MNDLNRRFAFADRWFTRRVRDAVRFYEAGAITARELWFLTSDDMIDALVYRTKVKIHREPGYQRALDRGRQTGV